MIWSMLKIVLFVLAVVALSYLTAMLADTASDVTVVVADLEITIPPVVLAIGIVLLFPVFWLFFFLAGLAHACIRFIVGDETALSRYLNKNRERRGFEALAGSLVALASGDSRLAQVKAGRAEKLLRRPELTGILAAQAAEGSGDSSKAVSQYKALLQHDETRFAGLSGLLRHKIDEGDVNTALKLAEKAFSINPKHTQIQDTLLKLQSTEEDWTGAARTLAAKLKSGKLPRDVFNRRNAILSFVNGRELLADGNVEEGEKQVLAANRSCAELVPAAVMASRIKCGHGDRKAATRIVRNAWNQAAHPDLAAAFAEIEPDETTSARRGRFAKLLGKKRNDPEARMIMSEILVADEDFPEARREIGNLAEDNPTVRSLVIMAAIERGSGAEDAVVRGWLTRAVSASRGRQWVCQACQHVHSEWKPLCENCEAFDSLGWREIDGSERMHTSSVGMLPLVVAAPEEDSNQQDEESVRNA
ncbi:MAG: heme biosynthesis protein HemY [Rhodobacteraceae bacterium]|nr:heme biosynthesis protein HemY [Paracoccaceae bacterium]